MDIAYAALTESCTFMLDAEGICRWVVAANPPPATPANRARAKDWEKSQQAAARCIGAQYVASLDVSTSGGLVDMPRVGVPMLFARVDRNGRVSLVRTGAVLRFEDRSSQEQVQQRLEEYDSGMRERPREECEYNEEVGTRRLAQKYDDEHTRPFQPPIGAVRGPRALPPPMAPREMVSRLPPPKSPPRRPRAPNVTPPPVHHRAAAPPRVDGDVLAPAPPRRGNPAPLWAGRRR